MLGKWLVKILTKELEKPNKVMPENMKTIDTPAMTRTVSYEEFGRLRDEFAVLLRHLRLSIERNNRLEVKEYPGTSTGGLGISQNTTEDRLA